MHQLRAILLCCGAKRRGRDSYEQQSEALAIQRTSEIRGHSSDISMRDSGPSERQPLLMASSRPSFGPFSMEDGMPSAPPRIQAALISDQASDSQAVSDKGSSRNFWLRLPWSRATAHPDTEAVKDARTAGPVLKLKTNNHLKPEDTGVMTRPRSPSIVLIPPEAELGQQTLYHPTDDVIDTDQSPSLNELEGVFPTSDYLDEKLPSTKPIPQTEIFPETIKYFSSLYFEHKGEKKQSRREGHLKWFRKDDYTRFFSEMNDELDRMRYYFPDGEAYKVYPKQSVFRLCFQQINNGRDDYYMPYVEIDQTELARQEIVRTICGYIFNHPFGQDHAWLEMHWDFSTLRNAPEAGTTFREMLSMEVHRKMKLKNFYGQDYLPSSDIKPFLTDEIVHQSLNSDREFQEFLKSIDQHEQDELIEKVLLYGKRLHLICVSQNWPFKRLFHWLKGGLQDGNYNDDTLADHPCDAKVYCAEIFDAFKEVRHRFFPYKWNPQLDPRKFHEFPSEKVLPIQYDAARHCLGRGVSGQVYRVEIDPDHHTFEGDRRCKFAMKRFYTRNTSEQEFRREQEVLEQLSKHLDRIAHVVTHLSCWSQRGDYCILYPLANLNLAKLMTLPRPEHSRMNVLWFLRGIKGLTDAVKCIHEASVPGNTLNTIPNPSIPRTCTFHHDLKPENILCFSDKKHGDGCVLKITDFGMSMISVLGSNDKSKSRDGGGGTATYQGPERKRTRPSDIWSLGCVFLEFILWFTTDTFRREAFCSERNDANKSNSGVSLDTFWYEKDGKEFLSPVVQERLREIESMRSPFPELAKMIREQLNLTPEFRIKAEKLDATMDQIAQGTEEVLREQPDFFLDLNRDVTTPPRVMDSGARSYYSHSGSPDRSSLDVGTGKRRQRTSPSPRSDEMDLEVGESSGGVVMANNLARAV